MIRSRGAPGTISAPGSHHRAANRFAIQSGLTHRSVKDDQHARGEGQELIEVARMKHDRSAARGRFAKLIVDKCRSSNVQPARWIVGDDEIDRALQLPRNDEALLVASRQRPRRSLR